MVFKFLVFGIVLGSSSVAFATDDQLSRHFDSEAPIEVKNEDVLEESSARSDSSPIGSPNSCGGVELLSASSSNAELRKEESLNRYFDELIKEKRVNQSLNDVRQKISSWHATEEEIASWNEVVRTLLSVKEAVLSDFLENSFKTSNETGDQNGSVKALFSIVSEMVAKVDGSLRSGNDKTNLKTYVKVRTGLVALSRSLNRMIDDMERYCD